MDTKKIKEKYNKIVALYYSQTNLSFRTSEVLLLQQYSTPAPLGYIMGVFAGIDKTESFESDKLFFEPSAGTGMLTVAGKPKYFIVNELDPIRLKTLRYQNFKEVLTRDASVPFPGFEKKFDAVLTNPPFGSIDEPVYYDEYPINSLEILCALRALDTMKNEGKAAFIIGGHIEYDSKGRIQAGKNRIFFSYLHKNYNVVDIINIDSQKLYNRMGTGFNIRIILIDGRKTVPFGFPPLKNDELSPIDNFSAKVVDSFETLFDRIIKLV